MVCNNTSPPTGETVTLEHLKVNALDAPITIDDPRPHFSWQIYAGALRSIVANSYEILVTESVGGAVMWNSGIVESGRTTYIPYGGAKNLSSDTTYEWKVRSHTSGMSTTPTARKTTVSSDWYAATFSTALIQQSDWSSAQWISIPDAELNTQFASQMRKVFTIPAAAASEVRVDEEGAAAGAGNGNGMAHYYPTGLYSKSRTQRGLPVPHPV